MIVENKVLVDRVDAALGQAPTGDIGTSYDEINQSKLAPGDMDSLGLSQSFIGASITLTGRGGTSRQIKPEDLEDMDELPDSLVDRMYNDLVADKVTGSPEATERSEKPTRPKKTDNRSRKRKTIAPAASRTASKGFQPAQKKYAPNITAVGKKAKSRLFDYESDHRSASTVVRPGTAGRNLDDNERHELRKQETLRQVRLAAEEKKKELNQHLRESISRERTAQL